VIPGVSRNSSDPQKGVENILHRSAQIVVEKISPVPHKRKATAKRRAVLLAGAMAIAVMCSGAAVAAREPSQPTSARAEGPSQDPTSINNRGVLEAKAGRFEESARLLRQASALAPDDLKFRTNLSGVLTDWAAQLERQGQLDRAIAMLEEAVTLHPSNGLALVRLGDLHYVTRSDLSRAVACWKQAHGDVPAQVWRAVSQRIAQAELDMRVERTFANSRTEHFQIRFERAEHDRLVARLGALLEQAYGRLSTTFGATPGPLTVILYDGGNFARMAGRRDWALGLYDGRIRLRLDEAGAEHVETLIAHELAHAFLAEIYGAQIPVWIHEGFAQLQEPARTLTGRQQELLRGVRSGTNRVPLKWLDQRFVRPSDRDDLERAYIQAWWSVEMLIERYGASRFRRFLEQLATGKAIDQAFDATFAPSKWARFEQSGLDPL